MMTGRNGWLYKYGVKSKHCAAGRPVVFSPEDPE